VSLTLVRGGCLYPGDAAHRVVPDGSVLVDDSRVVAAGPTPEVEASIAADDLRSLRVVDARGHMILPGFVNPHWHEMFAMRLPFKGALRPASDRDDEPGPMALGGALQQVSAMFDAFYDKIDELTPAEALAIARYSMWTQLRSGVTTLADVGSFNRPEALAVAARSLGMRCMISTWATDGVCAPGEDRFRRTRDADEVLVRMEDVLRSAAEDGDEWVRARPTAVYVTNMSDELCAGIAELQRRFDSPFATHVGALRNEAEVMRAYFGETGVRRMAAHGLLSDRFMAVHCAFADDEETQLLVEAGAHISHSPAKYGQAGESSMTETNAMLELRGRGLDVSVSTDGTPMPLGGMVENMRAAWQFHNEMSADPTRVLPSDALAMATRIAARGLRWDEVGSLEPGMRADLLLVRTDDWRYLLNPRPLESFVSLGSSTDVDTVMIGGQVVVEHGAATRVDEQELESDYLDALASFSVRVLGIAPEVSLAVTGRAPSPVAA
jgi:cytosine/adenosine deaminase-related metal-dependent hydrolase